jgi:hypothetical protein
VPTSVTLANDLIVPLHVSTSEGEKVDIDAGGSATVAISSPRLTVDWESDKLIAPNGLRVGQKVAGSLTLTRNSLREDSTVEITALSGADAYFMPKLKTTGTRCRWIGNALTDIEKPGPYSFDVLRGKGQRLGYYRYVPNDSNVKLTCGGVSRWWGANDLDGDGKLSGTTFSVDELDPKTGAITFSDANEAH